MRRIVHHQRGEPAQVLRIEDGPSARLGSGQVRIRLSCAPIHPGDLHGITGSPAFGLPPAIAPEGRVPGFEIAERYPPSRIPDAVAHVGRAGRAGVIPIDFSRD